MLKDAVSRFINASCGACVLLNRGWSVLVAFKAFSALITPRQSGENYNTISAMNLKMEFTHKQTCAHKRH